MFHIIGCPLSLIPLVSSCVQFVLAIHAVAFVNLLHIKISSTRVTALPCDLGQLLRRIVLTSISCRVDLASHSMALASGKHVSVAEQDLVDKITRRDEGSPMDAVRAIGRARERRGEAPVHKTAVYRYFKGSIHRRAKKERRRRP